MVSDSITVEGRLAQLTLFASVVPSVLLVITLWLFNLSIYVIGIVIVLLSFLIIYCVSKVWQKSQFQFRILHNLLDTIVQGDYSFRGLSSGRSGAYRDLVKTINALASTLQKQRINSEENLFLLKKIVDQFDVAIVTWDENDRIKLLNPAARQLLDFTIKMDGQYAISSDFGVLPKQLKLANEMSPGETKVSNLNFPKYHGRFRLHMERFIADGKPHSLLFITNVSNILRLEEKKAWQNLIRVLSHEINNSLSPLSSLSSTLKKQVQKREQDPVLAKELDDGLSIVGKRAESLTKFVRSYQDVAKLPEPKKTRSDLKKIISSLTNLFPDEEIVFDGEDVELLVDASQIEQVFINLLKNSVESNAAYNLKNDTNTGQVGINWSVDNDRVMVTITDEGEGLKNQENVFTPYYTTKASGSGIGLVLCKQIVEAHQGYLSVGNREDQHGCIVGIELPLTDQVTNT